MEPIGLIITKSDNMEMLLQRLVCLLLRKEDWNGHDAAPAMPGIMKSILFTLTELNQSLEEAVRYLRWSSIRLSPSGTVIIDWRKLHRDKRRLGRQVSVEIAPGWICWYMRDNDGKAHFDLPPLPLDKEALSLLIDELKSFLNDVNYAAIH